MSSFSRALLATTIAFYFIQIFQERQNTLSSKKFKAKLKRIALSASLFTLIQIIMTSIFDAILYHEEIMWTKSIEEALKKDGIKGLQAYSNKCQQ